jgi:hypothetical protein
VRSPASRAVDTHSPSFVDAGTDGGGDHAEHHRDILHDLGPLLPLLHSLAALPTRVE